MVVAASAVQSCTGAIAVPEPEPAEGQVLLLARILAGSEMSQGIPGGVEFGRGLVGDVTLASTCVLNLPWSGTASPVPVAGPAQGGKGEAGGLTSQLEQLELDLTNLAFVFPDGPGSVSVVEQADLRSLTFRSATADDAELTEAILTAARTCGSNPALEQPILASG